MVMLYGQEAPVWYRLKLSAQNGPRVKCVRVWRSPIKIVLDVPSLMVAIRSGVSPEAPSPWSAPRPAGWDFWAVWTSFQKPPYVLVLETSPWPVMALYDPAMYTMPL